MKTRMIGQMSALVGASLLLSACLNFGAAPGAIEAPDEFGGVKNVVIYRRPAFFLDNKPIVLVLDNLDIVKIRVNEFVEISVGQGTHIMGARCSTSERPLTRAWRLVQHELTVYDSRELRFIELGPCQFTEKSRYDAERVLGDYSRRVLKDSIRVRLRDWARDYNSRVEESRE